MRTMFVAVILAGLGIACGATNPCACPPEQPQVELRGTVTTAGNQPVSGATIHTYVGRPLCPARDVWLEDSHPLITGTSGEYFRWSYAPPPATTFCLRVVAHRQAQTDSVVVEQVVTDTARSRPGQFRVDLVFSE